MKIAIYGSDRQGDKLADVIRLIRALDAHDDVEVEIESDFASTLPTSDIPTFRAESCRADLALSLGGDGTFLAAARALIGRDIPLMGINTGHLGYLAGMSIADAPAMIDAIAAGDVTVERRAMLEVSTPGGLPEGISPFALNEVAILKQDSASMIEVDTRIDSHPLARYNVDGLIVATPTGSTAYNLSVGGPIVDPNARVLILSPIAPHTLTMRPLVVADTSVIDAVTYSRTGIYRLSIDGRSLSLPAETPVTIRRAECHTLLARPHSGDYLTTLRSKLRWGE